MRKLLLVMGVLNIMISVNAESPFFRGGKHIVCDKNVPVFEAPDAKSKIIGYLPILHNVFYKKEKPDIDGFVYIDPGMVFDEKKSLASGSDKGWVKRNTLANEDDFKPVDKTEEVLLITQGGDWDDYFHVYQNGEVHHKSSKTFTSKPRIGKLYQYKNIMSLNHYLMFYIENDEYFILGNQRLKVIRNKKDFKF